MRALLTLLLLCALAAPALARPYACGHRHGYRSYRAYRGYSHGHRYRHHRHYRHVRCSPSYRAYAYRPYRRYGHGNYRYHRTYHPYRYHGRYYRAYARPYVSLSPFYTRAFTVLTLDDEAFDAPAGASPAVDHDGLPESRSKPVGARFVVQLD